MFMTPTLTEMKADKKKKRRIKDKIKTSALQCES